MPKKKQKQLPRKVTYFSAHHGFFSLLLTLFLGIFLVIGYVATQQTQVNQSLASSTNLQPPPIIKKIAFKNNWNTLTFDAYLRTENENHIGDKSDIQFALSFDLGEVQRGTAVQDNDLLKGYCEKPKNMPTQNTTAICDESKGETVGNGVDFPVSKKFDISKLQRQNKQAPLKLYVREHHNDPLHTGYCVGGIGSCQSIWTPYLICLSGETKTADGNYCTIQQHSITIKGDSKGTEAGTVKDQVKQLNCSIAKGGKTSGICSKKVNNGDGVRLTAQSAKAKEIILKCSPIACKCSGSECDLKNVTKSLNITVTFNSKKSGNGGGGGGAGGGGGGNSGGGGDAACTGAGGQCQTGSTGKIACKIKGKNGTYKTGLCAGSTDRRCCIPSSGGGGGGGGTITVTQPPPSTGPSGGPSGNPTATPVPGEAVTLVLKLSFQGILAKPQSTDKMDVQVALAGGGLSQNLSQKGTFTSDDTGTWSGTVDFSNVPPGADYRVLVKGPKHVQKKICVATPTETSPGTYHCADGQISLTSGTNQLDFSGIRLLVGDLPDQDGIVDSYDVSLIRNNLGSTDPGILDKADVNLDGFVDTQDYSLLIQSLNVKYDEE